MSGVVKALAFSALFGVAVSCATPAKAAMGDRHGNWMVVSEDDGTTVLIEIASMISAINSGISYRTVWFKHQREFSNDENLIKIQFDCAGQRFSIKNFISYKDGKSIGSTTKDAYKWDDIIPDSNMKTLSLFVCHEPSE